MTTISTPVSIKCGTFNEIRRVLKPNGLKGAPSTLTTEEKLAAIIVLIDSASGVIKNYRTEKRFKKQIHKARIARGYKFKRKTTLEQYKEMLQAKESAGAI